MGKLQAALAWAGRGFPVFPLAANEKEPAFEASWVDLATTDPERVRMMWTDPVLGTELDYNIGAACTGSVVVDVDIKNGKDGHNQYMQLGGNYDTLVVRTPTGGFHCYFKGPDSSNAPIADGVDIRSHNGFVVAPGSTIDGVAYEVIIDCEPVWIPPAVERLLTAPYARRETGLDTAIDSAASVEAGIRYLQSAPIAREGFRGDETTFITSARLVREFALSPVTAHALLCEHWNPRCEPPWDLDQLYDKVLNAARYGTAEMGKLDPSIMFRGINIEPPPSVFQDLTVWGNALDACDMPPRPWLMDRVLMLHELTLLLAPGSAGKSSLSLALVAHMALGLPFGNYRTHVKCKSIVYNGEDDRVEQSRRLYAVCQSYGLDYVEVKEKVLLLSAEDLDLKFVGSQGRTALVNEAVIKGFIDLASDPDVGLVVLDPLVDIHDVDETDNPQMNTVMRVMKRVAREANVASLILHHTTKGGSVKQEDRVGNMEISRGASGIIYKVRIAFTLLNASQSDCEEYGLQDSERDMWVRLDDAKMNLALANKDTTWLHKEGIKLPNGDVVGVLKMTDMKKNTVSIRTRLADALISTMVANGQGSMTMSQAIAVLKSEEPIYSNKTDAAIKQRLEGLFSIAVEVRGHTLQAKRDGEGAKQTLLMVLS